MPSNTFIRAAALVAVTSIASGCSSPRDPASEAPVDPTPGNYHVTMTAGGLAQFVQQGPGTIDDNICLEASDASRFPKNLALNYFSSGDARGCSFKDGERQGNAIGGSISCRTDPQRAPGGSMGVEYQGTVSADRVELEGKLKMTLPPSVFAGMSQAEAQQMKDTLGQMENLAIKLTAERTGDCQ